MKSGVLSMDIADHCPIFLITFKEQTKQSTTLYHKYKRKINETNRAKFKLKVGKYTWTEILQSVDPQKAFTLFSEYLSQAYDFSFPLHLVSPKPHHTPIKPWITPSIMKSLNT